MTTHLQEVGLSVIFAAAVLTALIQLGRYARAAARAAARTLDKLEALDQIGERLEVVESLVSRELDYNHGGSMRDDVHGLAVAVGSMQRTQDALVRAHQRQHPADPITEEISHDQNN